MNAPDVAAAPAPTASGRPSLPPHQATGCPEAVAVCCALALGGNPISGIDTQRSFTDRVVATVRASYTPTQILRWRQISFASEWTARWRWARRAVRRLYPELPGAADLPEDHDDARLPEVVAACVT